MPTLRPNPSLLLTGFGSFPGVPRNFSFDLALAVADTLEHARAGPGPEKILVNTAKLDVDWHTISANLSAIYARYQPQLAIHFGVCRTVTGLTIERTAHNAAAREPDTVGCLPKTDKVCAEPAKTRCTRLPVESFASHLSGTDIDIDVSNDAGRYLCNAAYYLSLREAGHRASPADALFVHIPAGLTPSSAKWTAFVDAATDLALDALNAQTPPSS